MRAAKRGGTFFAVSISRRTVAVDHAPGPRRCVRDRALQALDGDLLAGRHVDGALDRAEAAAAERRQNEEAAPLPGRILAGKVGLLVRRPEAVGGGAHLIGQRRQTAGAGERLGDGGLRFRHVTVRGEDAGEMDARLDLMARQVVVGEAQTRLAQGGDRRLRDRRAPS